MDAAPGDATVEAVPGQVQELVDVHLRALDETAPGLVELLYLTGSVALGDYRPGDSDIDFLAPPGNPPAGSVSQ